MALDRNQAGILFNIDVDASNAQQNLEMFKGAVSGAAAEMREQFSRIGGNVQQSVGAATQSVSTLGQAATNQLRDFASQFGVVGEAAGDMVPALSGSMAIMVGLAGAAVAAGAALASTAIQAMDYTGKIDDLATETNLTTETIQSLRLAAALSGKTFEETAQTAVFFQKKMEEAKSGNAELAATFKALGVDLNGPVDTAFRKTLESFNQVADGAAKTKTATDLFGKSGAGLLGVMDQVGGSFDNLTAKAKDYGLVLDQDAIAKSNELADRIDVLKLRLGALTTEIGIATIRTFDNWSTAIGRVSITMKQLYSDTSTIVPNIKKLFAAAFLSTMPGGSPVDLSKLFAEPKTGYSGPGIDPTTGLPTLELPKPAGATTRTGGGAAKPEKLVSLPSGDAIARAYEQYRQIIANEEKVTAAQREKLRVEAIDGEEARLRDRLIQQDESIARARAEATAGARTGRADVLNAIVANLEAEKALTQKAISEMEAARVRAMIRLNEAAKANTEKRLADEMAAEEKRLDDEAMAYELHLERIDDLRAAADARRQAALEADPSSPLNIFGKAGQDAADKGAGIFGQLGASAKGALSDVTGEIPKVAEMMNGMFSGIANGLQNMIQGFILTGKLGGAAFKAMAAQVVSALASEAAVKAIFNLAEGFAALAAGLPTKAAQNFTAAKIYGVVAGVAAAAAVGMSAIGPGGGGGGDTQFLSESRGGGGSTMREQGNRRSEPQVIIIRAETEPGVMVSKFVQDYRQNGEARGVLRRDLLGEY